MNKNLFLECNYFCRSHNLVLLSYSEDQATYIVSILRTIAAGCPLRNTQEEGEWELDWEGRVSLHHAISPCCTYSFHWAFQELDQIQKNIFSCYNKTGRWDVSGLLIARWGLLRFMLFDHVAPSLVRLKSLSSSLLLDLFQVESPTHSD